MEVLPSSLRTVALAKAELSERGLQVRPEATGRVLLGVLSRDKRVLWARFATVEHGKVVEIE